MRAEWLTVGHDHDCVGVEEQAIGRAAVFWPRFEGQVAGLLIVFGEDFDRVVQFLGEKHAVAFLGRWFRLGGILRCPPVDGGWIEHG